MLSRIRGVLVVITIACGPSGGPNGPTVAHAQGPKTASRSAQYESVVEKNVMIPMRDGVSLAADIYRPGRDGKPSPGRFPALLTRTPYNKDGVRGEGRYYAERGYVVVANDVRGRYASEGTWRLIADDPADGFDVVEWIARAGLVRRQDRNLRHQLSRRHPACAGRDEPAAPDRDGAHRFRFQLRGKRNAARWGVRAAVHELDFPDRRPELEGRAGQPRTSAGSRRERPANPRARRQPARPAGNTPLRVVPEYESWLVEAMRSGPESPFWHKKGMSVVDHVGDYADVPVLHVTGWYDSWTRQVTMNYEALSKAKKSPQRLVIGPWTHGGQNSNTAGEVEFTPRGRHRPPGFPAAVVRSLAQGREERRRRRPAGALYIMGTGDDRRSPAGRLQARRLLARRARVAPGASPCDPALFDGRRHARRTAPDVAVGAAPPTRLTPIIPCRPLAAISRPTRGS